MNIQKELARLIELKDRAYPNYPEVLKYEKQIRILRLKEMGVIA